MELLETTSIVSIILTSDEALSLNGIIADITEFDFTLIEIDQCEIPKIKCYSKSEIKQISPFVSEQENTLNALCSIYMKIIRIERKINILKLT